MMRYYSFWDEEYFLFLMRRPHTSAISKEANTFPKKVFGSQPLCSAIR